jgi:hypothetical protein
VRDVTVRFPIKIRRYQVRAGFICFGLKQEREVAQVKLYGRYLDMKFFKVGKIVVGTGKCKSAGCSDSKVE